MFTNLDKKFKVNQAKVAEKLGAYDDIIDKVSSANNQDK